MIKRSKHLLVALVPILAAMSVPASACKVVGYKNGERLCMTTSDATGFNKPKTGGFKMDPINVMGGAKPINLGPPTQIGKFDLSTKGIIKGVAKGMVTGALDKLRRR